MEKEHGIETGLQQHDGTPAWQQRNDRCRIGGYAFAESFRRHDGQTATDEMAGIAA